MLRFWISVCLSVQNFIDSIFLKGGMKGGTQDSLRESLRELSSRELKREQCNRPKERA